MSDRDIRHALSGHNIVCVTYGTPPCNVVIIDFDNEEDDPPGNWNERE